MKLKYQLPEIYHRFLPKALLEKELYETKATCDDCAMQKGRTKTRITYRADLKCCTFYPFMPNYLIGALLSDSRTSVHGRAAIDEILKLGRGCLPIGFVAPVTYQLDFETRKDKLFGNHQPWLCPYYDKKMQNCGIWRNRGSVCTSFICKSSYGKKGMSFWRSLGDHLSYLEMALAEEVLAELAFSPREVSEQLRYLKVQPRDLHEEPISIRDHWTPSQLAGAWKDWVSEKEALYLRAYEIVSQLPSARFEELLGDLGRNLESDLLFRTSEI